MDLNSLGKRLAAARDKISLTQSQAAELIGISERALQGHEYDDHRPGNNTIKKYCEIYNCSRKYLLLGQIDHIPVETLFFEENKPELQDGDGLYENILDLKVKKFPLIIKELEREEGRWEKVIGIHINEDVIVGLREIFDSNDPALISAIQANIRAFQIAIRRKDRNIQLAQQIKTLQDVCNKLKKRIKILEMKFENSQPAPPGASIAGRVK